MSYSGTSSGITSRTASEPDLAADHLRYARSSSTLAADKLTRCACNASSHKAILIMNRMNWIIRVAQIDDIPELERLIPISVRALQQSFYSPAQMDAALGPVFGVDYQLIGDGTYFVVEHEKQIIGCGGWSKRNALFGGRSEPLTDNTQLDPRQHSARIRAFFVHPEWARQGIGRAILLACETAIQENGFHKAELVATLAGEPLYTASGFIALERYEIELPDQLTLPVVRMAKDFV